MPERGLFIVFEGLDRSGKSTQCQRLKEYLSAQGKNVRIQRYPDRSEPTTGPKIDNFLKTAKDVTQDAVKIHNLFVENRRILDKKIRAELEAGNTVIADRYSFSGIAYSASKDIPDLSLQKTCESELGLLRPDIVIFLNANADVTSVRSGFGDEVLEKAEFQDKVYQNLNKILNNRFWRKIDASEPVDKVATEVFKVVDEVAAKKQVAHSKPASFTLADFNVPVA